MANSKVPSVSATASTSRGSRASGVMLTPQDSEASPTSSGAPILYTPAATSEVFRTPTASIVSGLPSTSTSLNAVFTRLEAGDQRKSLRSLQNSVLSKALGCKPREVRSLIVTASSDELWAAFCQLNVENKRRSLQSTNRAALEKAFREESGRDDTSVNGNSYSTSANEVATDTLASAFKKLSVANQEKALTAVQVQEYEKNGLRRGASGSGSDHEGGNEDQDEILLDSKPDLAEWQELCRACGVPAEDIPNSINKCKEALKSKNVALADLSNAIRDGTVAQTFPTLSQLRKYVQSNNKVANLAATKGNRFLKKMLRELWYHKTR